jgi:hypothetical protein
MALELVGLTVVETRGRLVKQKSAGPANDRAGEFHEFLLTVGEAARLPVRQMRDSEAREHGMTRLSLLRRAARREPERFGDQEGQRPRHQRNLEVLQHRQPVECLVPAFYGAG